MDTRGDVYIVANRGMYCLPHSGLLANELLEKRLNKRGYQQRKLVPGLWKHECKPIQFTLVVDDFGVKYVGKEHALHLKQTLDKNCKLTTEWDVTIYIGITLDWDYKLRQVHIPLPGYTDKSRKQFNHTKKKNQNQPYPSEPIIYGAKNNMQHNHPQCCYLKKKERNLLNRSVGKKYFSEEPSTAHCYAQSVTSHHNPRIQPKRK